MNQPAIEVLRKRLEPIACVNLKTREMPQAAVAIILDSLEEVSLLLIRRTIRQSDPWSGQIAFPGGRMTKKDTTLLETAIRETQEEVGINLLDHEFLGAINDVCSTTRSLLVTPFVASLRNKVTLVLEKDEIAEANWVPIRDLRETPVVKRHIKTSEGKLEVDGMPYRNQIIWGLTLRVINDLLSRLDDKNRTVGKELVRSISHADSSATEKVTLPPADNLPRTEQIS